MIKLIKQKKNKHKTSIGRSRQCRPKNKSKRRNFKRYNGQGK